MSSGNFKSLLNLPEAETDRRLQRVCDDFGARVFSKIRVADVVRINGSGITDDLYRYALQAHFDFVIADERYHPLFAIEFDGPSHANPSAKSRDKMKNAICEQFELPLLRINRRYLTPEFSKWDLLGWFSTVFFIKRYWDEDVEAGRIHNDDSIFDPMFVSVKTKSGSRSLELERDARKELVDLFTAGEIPLHGPNWIVAGEGDRILRGISWISTTEREGVIIDTGMQPQLFDNWVVILSVRGIVLSLLAKRVRAVLAGEEEPIQLAEIDSRVAEFKDRYSIVMSCEVR